MQRAFIVKLDVGPGDSVEGIADDIKDVLDSEGYSVLGVNPWSANTLNNLAPEEGELKGEKVQPQRPSYDAGL